jgi:hypothetical protein
MTEYGSGGSAVVSLYVKHGVATILANQNSVTVTHNLGYIPTGEGVVGEDDNASVFKIINKTATQMDIAFQGGITQVTDTVVAWIAS